MKTSLVTNKKNILFSILWIFILFCSSLLLSLRWNPVFQYFQTDSGVYAYVGSSILQGQLPYRDVWEQKPPIGFYINALALLVFGRSPWGMWWFNVLWVGLTVSIFFLLIKKMMGTLTGCLASIFFLAGIMLPEVFQGGNLMEVYALLPQVLTIAAIFQFFDKKQERWVFIAGLLTGIAFMTKQTTIALGFSSILAVFILSLLERKIARGFIRLFSFGFGFVIPTLLSMFYWFTQGALNDFMDGVFLHSLSYVGTRVSFLWSLKNTALEIFPKMSISLWFFVACVAFIFYLVENRKSIFSYFKYGKAEISPVELTMLGVFIALPFEIIFASLGARNFGHYFLTLAPATATVSAYIIWKVTGILRLAFADKRAPTPLAVGWLLLSLFSVIWLGKAVLQEAPSGQHLASISKIFSGEYELSDLEKYIIETTSPDDKVLVWHIHTGINLVTQRQAAARVLFPMNLFIGDSKMPEFVTQAIANPPTLIVIQKPSSAGMPFIDELLADVCTNGSCMPEIIEGLKRPVIYNSLQQFQAFFQSHYVLDKQIYDWYIYRLVK